MSKLFDEEELDINSGRRKPRSKVKVSGGNVKKNARRAKRKKRKRKRPLYMRVARKKRMWPPALFWPCYIFSALVHLLKRSIAVAIGISSIGAALIAFFAGMKAFPVVDGWWEDAGQAVQSSTSADFMINESTTVYDKDGNVLAVLREAADQEYIAYKNIPKNVINAFVAVEDRSFWENKGIDVKGIFRVIARSVLSRGEEVHGASTITQQLARNAYLTHEVSIERKVKEIFLALKLDGKYTKEQVMEFYVNDICYANGIYGIGGAAKAYFNKDVEGLTLSECAYLCAIPNSPSYYDPYIHPDRALERRDKILGDMLEEGYITQKEHDKALAQEIAIQKPVYEYNDYGTTYAVDCAVRYLMGQDGFAFRYEWDSMDDYQSYQDSYDEAYASEKHNLYTHGYKVYTSLDPALCETLQEQVDSQLSFNTETDEDTGIYSLQGAAAIVDNQTRKVVAIVGGRSQEDLDGVYSLNRAYQSYRQPGSSFKPLAVYTPALSDGFADASIVEDIDVTKAKEPGTDVQALTGKQMTLRSAVENSKNGVAWKIFDEITPRYGLGFVTAMHFAKIVPDDYYDAAALGGLTYGTTTVEMAGAYSTLANHGEHVDPTCIMSILDTYGEEVYEEPQPEGVYTDKAADDMVDILKGVLTRGTASKLGWSKASKVEAFAKTGTTNKSKDGWLCGATPYYSIAVWVGYDTPKEISSLYGSSYPASIWKGAMLAATEGMEAASFERNSDDESYRQDHEGTGYYSYLEGRDDNEVLSEGYTVADYRSDRVIGEKVAAAIGQMEKVSGMTEELQSLYSEGCSTVSTIYSRKYKAQMQAELDAAYTEAANRGQASPTAQ